MGQFDEGAFAAGIAALIAEMEPCVYCGANIPPDMVNAAAPDDDDGWSVLDSLHYEGCQWIETRAHSRGSL